MGINVHLAHDQLPVATATSLALLTGRSRAQPQRRHRGLLHALESILHRLGDRDDDPAFVAAYTQRCDTLGRQVKVMLGGERTLEGVAEAVDGEGRFGRPQRRPGREVLGAGT